MFLNTLTVPLYCGNTSASAFVITLTISSIELYTSSIPFPSIGISMARDRSLTSKSNIPSHLVFLFYNF